MAESSVKEKACLRVQWVERAGLDRALQEKAKVENPRYLLVEAGALKDHFLLEGGVSGKQHLLLGKPSRWRLSTPILLVSVSRYSRRSRAEATCPVSLLTVFVYLHKPPPPQC